MNPLPVVVVPFYKPSLNKYEYISLKSIALNLSDYLISLLIPKSLATCIHQILEGFDFRIVNKEIHVVSDEDLSSQISYNQLMLSPSFYQQYNNFSHILIAQLDAYVFYDDLIFWCNQPYDYVGAAMIYPPAARSYGSSEIAGVGGFSLRRVDSFINALNVNPRITSVSDCFDVLEQYNLKGKIAKSIRLINNFASRRNYLTSTANALARDCGINEDTVYAYYLPKYLTSFRVVPVSKSYSFCIDKDVSIALVKSNGSLPFGAHSWWTNQVSLDAWMPFIPELH